MWLSFPRMIGVENLRLTALFLTLHAIFGTYVTGRFFWYKEWTSFSPVDDYMSVVVRSTTDRAGMREAEKQMWRSKPCNETGNFGRMGSVNLLCPRLCSTLNPSSHCMNIYQSGAMFDGSREVFFVTGFLETDPGGDFQSAAYYMTPFDKYQKVQLRYGMKLPFLKNKFAMTPGDDTTEMIATVAARYDLLAFSGVNVTTRLLNARGESVRTLSQPESLSFSLSEVLELAGVGDTLDTQTGATFMFEDMPANITSHAMRRFTGLEIVIRLYCRLQRQYLSLRWTEVVCDASFLPTIYQYAGVNEMLPDGSSRHYGGVRVRIMTRADAEFLDLSRAYQALVGAIVLASLPKLMVMFFARFCLGTCSKVYGSLICERFSLQEHITTMIMRWMVGFAAHKVLAKKGGLISQDLVADALRECVMKRSQRLNDEDLDALLRMCMQSVANTSYLSRRSKIHHPVSQALDSDNFTVACLNCEAVAFDDILCLFDTTRKRHLVERFFRPRELLEANKNVYEMKTIIRDDTLVKDQRESTTSADVDVSSLEGVPSTTRNDIIVNAEMCQDSDVSGCLNVNQHAHVNVEKGVNTAADEGMRDTLRSEIADLRVQCSFLQNSLQHQLMARLDALERNIADLWESVKSLPKPAWTTDGSTAGSFPASASASPTIVPKATSLEGMWGTGDIKDAATSSAFDPDSDVGAGATVILNETRTKVDEEPPQSALADARIEGLGLDPGAVGAALQASLVPTSRDTITAVPKRASNAMAVLGPAIIPDSGPLRHQPCPASRVSSHSTSRQS